MPENAVHAKSFQCLICDYKCSKQSNYNAHLLTRKHTRMTNAVENAKSLECKLCNFVCCKQSNYNIHLLTKKHTRLTNLFTKGNKCTDTTPTHVCICGKKYKYRQGLFIHTKNCNYEQPIEKIQNVPDLNNDFFRNLIKDVILQNKELMDGNKELQHTIKTVLENQTNITNNSITNNNVVKIKQTNNNKFNLNFFL